MGDLFPTFCKLASTLTDFVTSGRVRSILFAPVILLDNKHKGFLAPRWGVYMATLGLFAGIVTALILGVPDNPLRAWIWMRVIARSQETRYGFHAQLATPLCVEVDKVEPNGAFDVAGIKPGWAYAGPFSCTGLHQAELLYGQLWDVDGQTITLRFRPGGCNTTDNVVRVIIHVPRSA